MRWAAAVQASIGRAGQADQHDAENATSEADGEVDGEPLAEEGGGQQCDQ